MSAHNTRGRNLHLFQFPRAAGSYVAELSADAVLVSLNTIVWYKSNKEVDGTGDPNQLFEWLESVLAAAQAGGKVVRKLRFDVLC